MGGRQAPAPGVTRAELARLLGVSPARVVKYVEAGLPHVKNGRGKPATFQPSACITWLLERRGNGARPGEDEKGRYFRLQADRIEQQIRHRAGELVEAGDVARTWAGIVAAVRERLLSLPGTALSRGLVTAEHEDGLIALVDDVLRELAARGES